MAAQVARVEPRGTASTNLASAGVRVGATSNLTISRTGGAEEYLAMVRKIRVKVDRGDPPIGPSVITQNSLALSKDPALCHILEAHRFLLERQAALPAVRTSAARSGHPAPLTIPAGDRFHANELAECAAILSRNLYFRGVPPRRDEIEREWHTLEANRAWIRERLTFNGRNLMIVANGQTYATRFATEPAQARQWTRQSGGDPFYFGKAALSNLCVRLAGRTGYVSFHRPDELDPDSARNLKSLVLREIAGATNQVCGEFIGLLGHAVDSHFLLHGETIQDNEVSACISTSEIAQALKQSYAGASVDPHAPSHWKIVVLAACHSQEYLRDVHERLRQTPGLAVFVTDTEYGQVDYWNPTPLGSQFLEALLGSSQTSPNRDSLSLGALMDQESRLRWGNPSVFLRVQDAGSRWILQQVM